MKTILKQYTDSFGMEFVLIPAGSFYMGSKKSEEDRWPDEVRHKIKICKPFYMGKIPVTQIRWEAVMEENPGKLRRDDHPVSNVSWFQAQKFIKRLNRMEGTEKYRLPTEAEWEYAARAGRAKAYCFGKEASLLVDYAWYKENSEGSTPHPAGKKKPNDWGLHDMHGNVWEWVQDWFDEFYYSSSPEEDPKGPISGRMRVLRGGSWNDDAGFCRSASRNRSWPDSRSEYDGFRLAFSPE